MIVFRFHFSPKSIRLSLIALIVANIVFSIGTVVFIRMWEHLGDYHGITQSLITCVLVQFNLATENVISSWYSSMLLLAVAIGSVIAFASDTKAPPQKGFLRWLHFGWLLFGALFAGLSLDEMGSLHERLGMLSQLNFWGQDVLGWAYVMAPAIVLVAVFMLAFGWLHVRRVRPAFWLIVLGVVLFVSDPVLEQVEMTLLQGGAPPGSWALFMHDTLVIVEEGGLELVGGLCFLTATIVYVVSRTGGAPLKIQIESSRAIWTVRSLTVLFLIGLVFMHWAVAHLPPGDIGIPDNWFPSAGMFLLAVVLGATFPGSRASQAMGSRLVVGMAVGAIVISAYFGATAYAYLTWFRFDFLRQIFQTILATGFVGICVASAMGGNARAAWSLIGGGALVAFSVNVAGPYPPALAVLASGLCIEGLLQRNATPLSVRCSGFSR